MTDLDNGTREEAPRASMDVQSLNNLVVSFRKLMKRVQLFTIQKLVKQSKQLRTKRCSEEKEKQNVKKAEKLVQDVGAIKDLNIDQTIKFALGNTSLFSAIAATADLETRVKVRLATHPLMKAKVEQWRKEHDDWKALASFIASKNTGRRIKKKKKKQSPELGLKQKGSKGGEESDVKAQTKQPVPKLGDGKSAKEMARIAKKGDRISKKRGDKNSSKEQGQEASEGGRHADSSDAEDKAKTTLKHDRVKASDSDVGVNPNVSDIAAASDDSEESEDNRNSSHDEDDGHDDPNEASMDEEREEDSGSDSEESAPESDSSGDEECAREASPTPQKVEKEIKPFIKRSGEMVISKIDFAALSYDADIPLLVAPGHSSPRSKGVVEEEGPKEKPKPKKKKDGFFLVEGSDEEEEDQNDDAGSADEKEATRKDDYEPERNISKRKMESTFVSNLGKRSSRLWYSDFNNDAEGDGHQNRYHNTGHDKRSQESNSRSRSSWGDRAGNESSYPKGKRSRDQEHQVEAVTKKKALEDETLHPSWEARRKKKEQEKDIFSFAGKRTTFED